MAFIKRGVVDITGIITAENLEADKEKLKKLEKEEEEKLNKKSEISK